MTYQIKRLEFSDLNRIMEIIKSRPNIQLSPKVETIDNSYFKIYTHRLQQGQVNVFGALNDKEEIVAFFDTNRWNCDYINYTLGLGAVDKNITFDKSPNSKWPQVIIDLANHAVDFYEKEMRISAWSLRPNDKKWITYAIDSGCKLSKYDTEIVEKFPPTTNLMTSFDGKYNQISFSTAHTEQILVKMTKPNAKPFIRETFDWEK